MKHTPSRSDIPFGARNALPRRDLARLWGCSDREARRQFVQETESRAKSTFGALKGARHALRQLEAAGQENFFQEEK